MAHKYINKNECISFYKNDYALFDKTFTKTSLR